MSTYIHPDATHVYRLLNQLKVRSDGLQRVVAEIEALKYQEDNVVLQPGESVSGTQVHVGLTAELIENIKSAILTSPPVVRVKGYRTGSEAEANQSTRELFHTELLNWFNHPTPNLYEFVDAVCVCYGVLKVGKFPWPTEERKQKRGEKAGDYLKRMVPYKQLWGPPFRIVSPHPLTMFFEPQAGGRIEECIEHSYKPKAAVYAQYNIHDDTELTSRVMAVMPGQPDSLVRPMPRTVDTSTMVLVTEYYNPEWYQLYINGGLVYEKETPDICYFLCPGRTSSSRDPDKWAISIAENLRKNEPIINKELTRLHEAGELIVNKRLTLEMPMGSTPEMVPDDEGNIGPKIYRFKADATEALPEGSRVVDPFAGVENIYNNLPWLQLLMGITAQHGANPIFRGMPPGSSGSGYRDNSLYSMAKSQFLYLVDNIQYTLAEVLRWIEWCLCEHVKQEIYLEDLRLRPSDVKDWPAKITVTMKPSLPQNFIAEGEFGARMNATGMITKNRNREQFLGIEQPEEEEYAIMKEQLQDLLKPMLYRDVIMTVFGMDMMPGGEEETGPDNGVAPSLRRSSNLAGVGANGAMANAPIGRDGGRQMGGFATGGQPKRPEIPPGGTI